MKKVYAYQTSDGKFHQEKIPALLHEFKLDVRTLILSGIKGQKVETLNIGDVSDILAKNFEPLWKKMKCYKREVNWIERDAKRYAKPKPQATAKEILGN